MSQSAAAVARVFGLTCLGVLLATSSACKSKRFNDTSEQSSIFGGSRIVEYETTRYMLEKELGQGNFSTVFRARKEASGESVALKVSKEGEFREKASFEESLRNAFALTRGEGWRSVYLRYEEPCHGTLSERGLLTREKKREVLFVEGELADGPLSKLSSDFRHEKLPYLG